MLVDLVLYEELFVNSIILRRLVLTFDEFRKKCGVM